LVAEVLAMRTVRRVDVEFVPGLRPPLMTTAHDKLGRFYRDIFTPARKKSVLEHIVTAKSEFELEVIIKDAVLFASQADRRTWRTWLRAVRSRVHVLRGTIQ